MKGRKKHDASPKARGTKSKGARKTQDKGCRPEGRRPGKPGRNKAAASRRTPHEKRRLERCVQIQVFDHGVQGLLGFVALGLEIGGLGLEFLELGFLVFQLLGVALG
jgi:hypothetical protein